MGFTKNYIKRPIPCCLVCYSFQNGNRVPSESFRGHQIIRLACRSLADWLHGEYTKLRRPRKEHHLPPLQTDDRRIEYVMRIWNTI